MRPFLCPYLHTYIHTHYRVTYSSYPVFSWGSFYIIALVSFFRALPFGFLIFFRDFFFTYFFFWGGGSLFSGSLSGEAVDVARTGLDGGNGQVCFYFLRKNHVGSEADCAA